MMRESTCAVISKRLVNGVREKAHLVEHVLDQLDLVGHLGTTEDSKERPLRILKRLRKELQLLLHQEPGCPLGELDAHHGRVRPMSSPERIVDIHIPERRKLIPELLDVLCRSLRLRPILVLHRPLLLDVETQVLEQEDRAGRALVDCAERGVERGDELDVHAERVRDGGRHGLERVFGVDFAVGAAEVGHEDHGLGLCWRSASSVSLAVRLGAPFSSAYLIVGTAATIL